MSLANRLNAVNAQPKNDGCRTCKYVNELPPADRLAFDDWITDGKSIAQLWEICHAEGLDVTSSPFRTHIKHHRRADEQ